MLAPILILLDLVALVAFVGVPGLLLSRLAAPDARGLERALLSIAAGFAGTSILAWSVAVVTFQRVTLLHVAGAAALLSLWAGRRLAKRERVFLRVPGIGRSERAGAILAAAVFALGMVNYDRSHFEYGCIHTVVQIALSDEVDLASSFADAGSPQERAAEGRRRTDPSAVQAERDEPPPWMMPLLLVGATGQRYGTTAMIAPLAAVHGFFGFRLVYALHLALLAGFLHLSLVALKLRPRTAALAVAFSVVNPYVLKVSLLDENLMAAAWASAALYCVLRVRPAAALAGLFAGAAIGIRHIDLGLLLGLGVLLAPSGRAALKAFALAAFAALLHELVHHQVAYGSLLSHEHFVDEVWYRTRYALGPWSFEYGGLLQWPFADQVIRTPYNGYPSFLLHPLSALSHLGLAYVTVAVVGLGVLLRRRLGLALALWAGPIVLLLALLEDWLDPNKMGIPLTIYPAVVLAFGLGVRWVAESIQADGDRMRGRVVVVVVVGLAVLGLGLAASRVDVPADPLFYAKYPLVREEVPVYAEEDRRRVASFDLTPDWTRLTQHSPLDPVGRVRGLLHELGNRDFRQGRIGDPPAPSSETATLTLELHEPWIGRRDFLRGTDPLDADPRDVLDLRTPGASVLLEGVPVPWADRPADILFAHDPGRVRVFVRFGLEDFADFDSRDGFTIDAKDRPELVRRKPRPGARGAVLLVPAGVDVEIAETVSLDQVLIFRWDGRVAPDGSIDLSPARKLFHN